jgi:hypothetical protein
MKQWEDKVSKYLERYRDDELAMAEANRDMVLRVVSGMGPDKPTVDESSGARAVVNISAVHIPSFCKPRPGEKPYKNTYDLQKEPVLGDRQPINVSSSRKAVDGVIQGGLHKQPADLYFAAVEINGTGVRFYGDMCLVLKRAAVAADTPVLTTNSYDLIRPPITPAGAAPDIPALTLLIDQMAGEWQANTGHLAALKSFDILQHTARRLTTGQISDAILEDEDYLEVLKAGTFGANDLQEARVSAADTAAEIQIGERTRLGPCPSLAEIQWRKQRLAAQRSLAASGVTVRVITTSGRTRS